MDLTNYSPWFQKDYSQKKIQSHNKHTQETNFTSKKNKKSKTEHDIISHAPHWQIA